MDRTELPSNLRSQIIALEYEYVCKSLDQIPAGIYITPTLENRSRWEGVIFVRKGPFTGGIFKFIIHFPNAFPSECFRIEVLSTISLPRLDGDGFLSLGKRFVQYSHLETRVLDGIIALHEAFTNITPNGAVNQGAARLLSENPDSFAQKASKEVKRSRTKVYNDDFQTLKFTKWNENHAKVRDIILEEHITKNPEVSGRIRESLENRDVTEISERLKISEIFDLIKF